MLVRKLFLLHNNLHLCLFPIISFNGNNGSSLFPGRDFPGGGYGGHRFSVGRISEFVACSSFGELCFYLEFPTGPDRLGFGVQLDLPGFFLNGNLHGGGFSVGGLNGNPGRTGFLSGNLTGCADGNLFIGSGVTQLFVGSVCRKGSCFQCVGFA